MAATIEVIAPSDIHWPFKGDCEPYILVSNGRWKRQEIINPFPCYVHDYSVVESTLRHVEERFPVGCPVTLYVLPHDTPAQVNGWECYDTDHNAVVPEGQRKPISAWICLTGKRIPPHPAMTRYLVAHEYGHVVEDWICYHRNAKEVDEVVLHEYAELRRLEFSKDHGGGNWHRSVGEVLANDFRILVAQVETEFWPHPGIERPEELDAVKDWWQCQINKHACWS